MRYLRYLALLSILTLPISVAHAQISAGVSVGAQAPAPYYAQPQDPNYAPQDPYYAPQYAYAPPVCPYGYYNYAPYACAPYGYYGPSWFVGGVFIGAGPWYHYGYRGGYAYGYRGGYYGGRPVYGRPVPYANGYRGGVAVGGAYRGGEAFHGNAGGGFHGGGGSGFHGGGGGGFHGGGGGHR